ncbi:MAG: hypothetical protein AB7V50_11645 [Vampirovibrionia bacterium]
MKLHINKNKTDLYKFLTDKNGLHNTTFLFDEKKQNHLKVIVKA